MIVQALLFSTFLLLEIGTAFGCSGPRGHNYVINLTTEHKCKFFLDPRNILQGENLRDFIGKNDLIPKISRGTANYCEKFDPTVDEEQALYTAILRYYDGGSPLPNGRITIERLSPEAHSNLLNEAKTINSDKCSCNKIPFVERIGDLTAHLYHNDACQVDGMCQSIPPKGCLSRIYYDYAKIRDHVKYHFMSFPTVTNSTAFKFASIVIGLSMLATFAALFGVILRRIFQKIIKPIKRIDLP